MSTRRCVVFEGLPSLALARLLVIHPMWELRYQTGAITLPSSMWGSYILTLRSSPLWQMPVVQATSTS